MKLFILIWTINISNIFASYSINEDLDKSYTKNIDLSYLYAQQVNAMCNSVYNQIQYIRNEIETNSNFSNICNSSLTTQTINNVLINYNENLNSIYSITTIDNTLKTIYSGSTGLPSEPLASFEISITLEHIKCDTINGGSYATWEISITNKANQGVIINNDTNQINHNILKLVDQQCITDINKIIKIEKVPIPN